MSSWQEIKEELNLTEEEKRIIALEEQLIESMIAIREEQGLSQAELARRCDLKQPAVARLEKRQHSPRLDSLLRVLAPLGYTLQIVPMKQL